MNLSNEASEDLLSLLKQRFNDNAQRHPSATWTTIERKLRAQPALLYALFQMEESGGEPDVVEWNGVKETWFFDCVAESPAARRSLCYDKNARLARKKHAPLGSVEEMTLKLGAELMDEQQYRFLQQIHPVDRKTSSWLRTPEKIRTLGGALFGDCRYAHTFIYHNGADSYYASRGFRTVLKI